MKPWPNPVYAVDSSFDKLTPEEVQRLKAAGVELFIQALWTGNRQPAVRVENLRVADDGGLAIAGYISLTSSFSGEWHMVQGRTGVPNDLWNGMRFVAPDVELPGIRVGEILAAAYWVASQHAGHIPIYTNYNSWTTKVILRNSHRLADAGFGLWNAYWDKAPDIDYPSLRFGGWEDDQVVGEQWSGGTYVGGQFVDRNTFKREFVFPKEEPMSEPVNPDKQEADFYKLAGILKAAAELTEEGIKLPEELRNMLAYVGIVWPEQEGS